MSIFPRQFVNLVPVDPKNTFRYEVLDAQGNPTGQYQYLKYAPGELQNPTPSAFNANYMQPVENELGDLRTLIEGLPPVNVVNIGTSTTASATAAKVATLTGYVRYTGSIVAVKFSNNNTAATPSLSVGGTPAAQIRLRGEVLPVPTMISKDTYHLFLFDGTYWQLLNPEHSQADFKLLQSYKTAGTSSWVAPDLFKGRQYYVHALIIGGGGSGSCASNKNDQIGYPGYHAAIGQGGASGYMRIVKFLVTPGTSYSVVIGAGGAAVSEGPGGTYYVLVNGNAGGTTSFNGVSVLGGEGGVAGYAHTISGSAGTTCINKGGTLPLQFQLVSSYSLGESQTSPLPYAQFRPILVSSYQTTTTFNMGSIGTGSIVYDWINKIHRLSGGGTGVSFHRDGSDPQTRLFEESIRVLLEDGLYNSAGRALSGINASGSCIAPTSPGCGGGGISRIAPLSSQSWTGTLTSAKGADGLVELYLGGIA